MGVTNSNKEVSTGTIRCGGEFGIRISLTAAPDITSDPTDIVLVLDRSRSMAGSPLANLKSGARRFIEIIDRATDSAEDGNIGNGSRIAIVSFATDATADTGLITSVAELDAAVDALRAGGRTNHSAAFETAVGLFDGTSSNSRVIVMFTDGETTEGPSPLPITDTAKADGVIIYCIGLSGSGGFDAAALESWASEPASSYVAITPDDSELEDLFEDLAANITHPGATDIVIRDTVKPCFTVLGVSRPTVGTAEITGDTSVVWKIDALGVNESEGAYLDFTVRHTGACTGEAEVNESISYTDAEGNSVSFPSPTVTVDCDVVERPEACPEPVTLTVGGCTDTVKLDAGTITLESLGRIAQIDVTLQSVCPGKRVALAVILTEVDARSTEYRRGMKTLLIPAHAGPGCRDVSVRCIKFVLPESLAVNGEAEGSMCGTRDLRARFIANYIDSGFDCCCDTDCTQ
ncbi:MAG: VWA domain-containing protein [Eubacteriales bacterium]